MGYGAAADLHKQLESGQGLSLPRAKPQGMCHRRGAGCLEGTGHKRAGGGGRLRMGSLPVTLHVFGKITIFTSFHMENDVESDLHPT